MSSRSEKEKNKDNSPTLASPMAQSPIEGSPLASAVTGEHGEVSGVPKPVSSAHSGAYLGLGITSNNQEGFPLQNQLLPEAQNDPGLLEYLQDLFETMVKATSKNISLENKADSVSRELEVYRRWAHSMGGIEYPDPEKQEVQRLRHEIEKLDGQKLLQKNEWKSLAHDVLNSFGVHRLHSADRAYSSGFSLRIKQLEDENGSLRQALDHTNGALREQNLRLAKLEDRRAQELQPGTDSSQTVTDEVMTKLEDVNDRVSKLGGILSAMDVEKASRECEKRIDKLEQDLQDTAARIQRQDDLIREDVQGQEKLRSELSNVMDCLGKLESQIKASNEGSALHSIQNAVHEIDIKHREFESRLRDAMQQQSTADSGLSGKVESHLTPIKKAIEVLQEQIHALGSKISSPAQGIPPNIRRLEERLEETQRGLSEVTNAVQEMRINGIPQASRSAGALEDTLRQQQAAIDNFDEKHSKLSQYVDQRYKTFEDLIQSLQDSLTQRRENTSAVQNGGRTIENPSKSPSQMLDTDQGWEVDEEGQAMPNSTLESDKTLEIKRKISTLETYIFAHEQRLNAFTLEPYLRSIIHQMRLMYPYPDNLSRSVESLRASNQQFVTQVAEVQGRLGQIEGEIKDGFGSENYLQQFLSQLNPIKQDIIALKTAVGGLHSTMKEQARELEGKRSAMKYLSLEESGRHQDGAEQDRQHPARLEAPMLSREADHVKTDSQAASAEVTRRLDEFVEEWENKQGVVITSQEKLKDDVCHILDIRAEESEQEFTHLREDISRVRAAITQMDESFWETCRDLTKRMDTFRKDAELRTVPQMQKPPSPAQDHEAPSSQAAMPRREQSTANYGQSILKRSKRKRGTFGSISEGDDAKIIRKG